MARARSGRADAIRMRRSASGARDHVSGPRSRETRSRISANRKSSDSVANDPFAKRAKSGCALSDGSTERSCAASPAGDTEWNFSRSTKY